jgi:hypothetical protein
MGRIQKSGHKHRSLLKHGKLRRFPRNSWGGIPPGGAVSMDLSLGQGARKRNHYTMGLEQLQPL